MTNRSSAVVTAVAAVVAMWVAVFVGASMLSSRKSRLAREGWNRTLGTYEEIMQRFPARETNASALQLEALCAPLGVEMAPRWVKDRERPSAEAARGHDAIKREMAGWLYRQLEQSRRGQEPPPAAVESFLRDRSAEIEAVRRHLIRSEVPRWRRQVERLFAAPLPNLIGHLELQKLLIADAQIRSRTGDDEGALDDLEASWRLNLALRDDPFLTTQRISMTVARMQAGALRQLGVVSPDWRDRLVDHDFRASFMTALAFEAWIWTQINDPRILVLQDGSWLTLVPGLAGPYVEYCISDVSEAYRRRLENLERVEAFCDADSAKWGADLDVSLPRWNAIGDMFVTDLSAALEHLASLELDFELTARLLELRQARSAAENSWPVALPRAPDSTACPGDRWDYETARDGSATLALGREVSWPHLRGLVLPTRFTLEP